MYDHLGWAAQIAVVAAGGKCGKNPKGREMGIGRKMGLTSEGRVHPMFVGRSTVFDAYISHYDEVLHDRHRHIMYCI